MNYLILLVLLSITTLGASLPPRVSILNAVSNKESIGLYCRITRGPEIVVDKSLRVGETFKWVVTKIDNNYTCTLTLGRLFSGITSYDPKRDAKKDNIFWKATDDGLFLGYDYKGKYTKVADWESE